MELVKKHSWFSKSFCGINHKYKKSKEEIFQRQLLCDQFDLKQVQCADLGNHIQKFNYVLLKFLWKSPI